MENTIFFPDSKIFHNKASAVHISWLDTVVERIPLQIQQNLIVERPF